MSAYNRACDRLASAYSSTRTVNLLQASGYQKVLPFNQNRVGLLIYPPTVNAISLYWDTTDASISATLVGGISISSGPLSIDCVRHGDLATRELHMTAAGGDGNITIVELLAPQSAQ